MMSAVQAGSMSCQISCKREFKGSNTTKSDFAEHQHLL
jgi:hypothetical protein